MPEDSRLIKKEEDQDSGLNESLGQLSVVSLISSASKISESVNTFFLQRLEELNRVNAELRSQKERLGKDRKDIGSSIKKILEKINRLESSFSRLDERIVRIISLYSPFNLVTLKEKEANLRKSDASINTQDRAISKQIIIEEESAIEDIAKNILDKLILISNNFEILKSQILNDPNFPTKQLILSSLEDKSKSSYRDDYFNSKNILKIINLLPDHFTLDQLNSPEFDLLLDNVLNTLKINKDDFDKETFKWKMAALYRNNVDFPLKILFSRFYKESKDKIINDLPNSEYSDLIKQKVEAGLYTIAQNYSNAGKGGTIDSFSNIDQFNILLWILSNLENNDNLSIYFGDSLEELKEKTYPGVLDISLKSMEEFNLEYFPRPESLRNIFILALTQQREVESNHTDDRETYAIKILNYFKSLPEWQDLVRDTIQKYPEIGFIESLIQKEVITVEDIQQAINSDEFYDFVLLIHKEKKNRTLLDCLPTDYLIKKSEMDGIAAVKIKELLSKLQELSNKNDRKLNLSDEVIYQINNHLKDILYCTFEQNECVFDLEKLEKIIDFLVKYSTKFKFEESSENLPKNLEVLKLFEAIDWFFNSENDISTIKIDSNNWQNYLIIYLISINKFPYINFSDAEIKEFSSVFNIKEIPNFILNFINLKIKELFENIESPSLPNELNDLINLIERFDLKDLGPYSYLEASLEHLINLKSLIQDQNTTEEKKQEVYKFFKYFENNLFSSKDTPRSSRKSFYNVSADLLVSKEFDVIKSLNLILEGIGTDSEDLLVFIDEIYPILIAGMSIFKNQTKIFIEQLKINKKDVKEINTLLQNFLKENISRLGIAKIPETIGEEEIRTVKNIFIYISNFSQEGPDDKKRILYFFLSQILNKNWNDFRSGKDINLEEYLTNPELIKYIETLLKEDRENESSFFSGLHLSSDEILKLKEILQIEVRNVSQPVTETVDIKLQWLTGAIRTLDDPDLYTGQIDKLRLSFVKKYGSKEIGAVVSKLFRNFNNQSFFKEIEATKDGEIVSEIKRILENSGLEFNQENLTKYFQEGLKIFTNVVSLKKQIEDEFKVSETISLLRERLKPSQEVIRVFQSVGEGFTPNSGAFALSSDLELLKSLIKQKGGLTEDEKQVVAGYIRSIKEVLDKLEDSYQKINERIDKMLNLSNISEFPQIKETLEGLIGRAKTKSSSSEITSILTNDMNIVIENIRQCLACKTRGGNNDTNLSFGEFYKFFLTTIQREINTTDQIIYVLPTVNSEGRVQLSFVMDTMYPSFSLNEFLINIDTIMKKVRQIRSDLEIDVNIVVSKGVTPVDLSSEIEKRGLKVSNESVKVRLPKSAFSQHYPEFGPNGRVTEGTFVLLNSLIIE